MNQFINGLVVGMVASIFIYQIVSAIVAAKEFRSRDKELRVLMDNTYEAFKKIADDMEQQEANHADESTR